MSRDELVRLTWWRTALELRERFAEWASMAVASDPKPYEAARPSDVLTPSILSAQATGLLLHSAAVLGTRHELDGWQILCDADRLWSHNELTLYAMAPDGTRHCIATLAEMKKPEASHEP